MSDPAQPDFNPALLDLHLGHLSDAERRALRERIAADPRLALQDEALTQVFAALAIAPHARMPHDLKARTVNRVVAAGPALRIVRRGDERIGAVERRIWPVISLGHFRDIVAVAALLVLAVGLGVPGMLHLRDRQQRLGCSWNLAQLGTGLQQYASTFGASFPFAGWSRPNYSWQPSNDPGVVTMPNHRHVYPLLRLAFVPDPRIFICPSQHHVPMPRPEIQRRDDFLEARNVSYAYQNMAGVRPSANDDPDLPLLADDNPLFADGLPIFDAGRLAGSDPTTGNSRAHGGAGQNILTISGHVKWTTTPASGINGDNIWILHGVTTYTGREGPAAATDSHLLK
jgi:hypothetical protein